MRNVRPSWVRVLKDDNGNGPVPCSVGETGTGPRSRSGSLSAVLLARIEGRAVEFLEIDAISSADGETTLVRITNLRTGGIVFEERVTQ
jgi:hypothetical protein